MMTNNDQLRDRFNTIVVLYNEAVRKGLIRNPSAQRLIEKKLRGIGALLAPSSLGDDVSPDTTARRDALADRFRRIVTLYATAVCAKKIREQFIEPINAEFVLIATLLSLHFYTLYDVAVQSCKPAEAPVPAVAPASEPIPAEPPASTANGLSLPDYTRSIRSWLMRQELAATEEAIGRNRERIEELEEKPESFEGTKKEWLESVKEELGTLRGDNARLRRFATMYNNEDLDEATEHRFALLVKSAWERSGGVLTDEQRTERIAELMPEIFAEESASEQFYPTPLPVIRAYVLANADIEPGLSILEPSAGKGNIADAVRDECPSCSIDVIELNDRRAELLQLKGYHLVGRDTLEYTGKQ
ncbi:MAG: hypothetical protein ABI876_13435, partial [Bacteroidota bacterium]